MAFGLASGRVLDYSRRLLFSQAVGSRTPRADYAARRESECDAMNNVSIGLAASVDWHRAVPDNFVLISMHVIHGSYDHLLYEVMKVKETTLAFYRPVSVKIRQSLRNKAMKIVSIRGGGLSSQRHALSDEDWLESLKNLLRNLPMLHRVSMSTCLVA
jgi:hypothetical protein